VGIRKTIGIAFLFAQCGSVLVARFIPERFFCWAPYDEHTSLETRVIIGDSELDAKEVNARYRYLVNGWEPRAIHNVFNIIQQYETTYGAGDSAEVIVTYSKNGHPQQTWRYPKPTE
jgi:hypothetical protein